ncbi:hypothetical protein DB42_EA00140 [Neochlamydia sp. EPS4]|uniref:hypothetical protein n=1 Tax=Neochlamydia sp. EPS4 TaxID=1478175 RepID=UPI0005828C42|nr:hypothetical protein [Neochlamydia sp. EPS4]KIC76142.1 hypothetical protein DB42_EA00140 [Neochlamydia sp. EPS4]
MTPYPGIEKSILNFNPHHSQLSSEEKAVNKKNSQDLKVTFEQLKNSPTEKVRSASFSRVLSVKAGVSEAFKPVQNTILRKEEEHEDFLPSTSSIKTEASCYLRDLEKKIRLVANKLGDESRGELRSALVEIKSLSQIFYNELCSEGNLFYSPRKVVSIGVTLGDFSQFLFNLKVQPSTGHDAIARMLRECLLVLKKNHQVPVQEGYDWKNSTNETNLVKWIALKEIGPSVVKNLMAYQNAIGALIELLENEKAFIATNRTIRTDFRRDAAKNQVVIQMIETLQTTPQLATILYDLSRCVNRAFEDEAAIDEEEEINSLDKAENRIKEEERNNYFIMRYHEVICSLKVIQANITERIQFEYPKDKYDVNEEARIKLTSLPAKNRSGLADSEKTACHAISSTSLSGRYKILNSSLEEDEPFFNSRSVRKSLPSPASSDSLMRHPRIDNKASQERKRQSLPTLDLAGIEKIKNLEENLQFIKENYRDLSKNESLKKALSEMILSAEALIERNLKDFSFTSARKRGSIGLTALDFKEVLFNAEVKPSEEHHIIVDLLAGFLLDLGKNRKIPVEGKKSSTNAKNLLKWIDASQVSRSPILNLYLYQKAMQELVTLIENEKRALAFSGKLRKVIFKWNDRKADALKKMAEDLDTSIQIASLLNEINLGLRRAFGDTVAARSEKGRNQGIINYVKLRYEQIINSLKNIVTNIDERIKHELWVSKKFPVYFLEERENKWYKEKDEYWESDKNALAAFRFNENLGSVGKYITSAKMTQAGKATEWLYVLESKALKLIAGRQDLLIYGSLKILAEVKNFFADFIKNLTQQLGYERHEIEALLNYFVIHEDDSEIMQEAIIKGCEQFSKMCQEVVYSREEFSSLLAVLKFVHQTSAYAYGPSTLNYLQERLMGQKLISSFRNSSRTKPTKTYEICFEDEEIILRAKGIYNVKLLDAKKATLSDNQVIIKEYLEFKVMRDQLLIAESWNESNFIEIVHKEPISKEVQNHLDVLQINLFKNEIPFKVKKRYEPLKNQTRVNNINY